MNTSRPIAWVQPFGMNAEGGSSRIFRSLLEGRTASVLVHGQQPPPPSRFNEVYLCDRPRFGRLENTRFWGMLQSTRLLRWRASRKRIRARLDDWHPPLVHSHVHGTGFIHAFRWCEDHAVPHAASFHDDIRHLCLGDPLKGLWERMAGDVWRRSSVRFVISPEMGRTYEARYGSAPWTIVTDGLDQIADSVRPTASKRLHVYFAGALNVPYEPCFLALQKALKNIQASRPDWSVRLILRGGRNLKGEDPGAPHVEVRPYADQASVIRDLEEIDVLYLPLSLDVKYADFARLSLSTKLVTYLGSGLPVFYHGPAESAAWRLLREHDAAWGCHSLSPDEIAHGLVSLEESGRAIVENALALARRDFRIADIRLRFHQTLQHCGVAE